MKLESIKYSLNNLRHRKMRSVLTIISILIGIATIFIFVSFGMGLYAYVEEISSGSSADKVIIQAKGSTGDIGLDTTFALTEDDLETVERTSGVYEVEGLYFKAAEIVQGKKKVYTLLFGFEPDKNLVAEMSDLEIIKGRELKEGDRNIIAGYNYLVPDKIFPKKYSLGQKIEVQGQDVKIVGFYNAVGNPQDDAQLYVTKEFIRELYPDETLSYNWIIARVDASNIDQVVANIEDNLRDERNQEEGKEDFFVQSFKDLIETYGTVLNLVVGFVIIIALISMLVSAVNTANTMVTSVLERVKEIGIMKSIGATNSEIFGLFLFESAFLGFVAGSLGTLLGFGLANIASAILISLGYSFLAPFYSFGLFFGCIAFAVVTGAISGIIPAIKAMRTNPTTALRYE